MNATKGRLFSFPSLIAVTSKARTIEECWQAFMGELKACGIKHALFTCSPEVGMGEGLVRKIQLTSYANDFNDLYFSEFHESKDVAFNQCLATQEATFWTIEDFRALDNPDSSTLAGMLQDQGVDHGITLPLKCKPGRIVTGGICFGLDRSELDLRPQWRSLVEDLNAATFLFIKIIHDLPHQDDLSILTERELAVLRCVVGGMTNKAIAHREEVSEKTIEQRLHRISQKLQTSNRAQSIVEAMKRRLL